MSPPERKFTRLLEDGRFEVFGFVQVSLRGPHWWWTSEVDEDGVRGPYFLAYDGTSKAERGYVAVLEALDPGEPDVSKLSETDINRFDEELRVSGERVLAAEGQKLLEWHGTVRNSVKVWDRVHLVTTYRAHDPDLGDRLHFDARTKARGRRLGLKLCFNLGLPDEETSALMSAWFNISLPHEVH